MDGESRRNVNLLDVSQVIEKFFPFLSEGTAGGILGQDANFLLQMNVR